MCFGYYKSISKNEEVYNDLSHLDVNRTTEELNYVLLDPKEDVINIDLSQLEIDVNYLEIFSEHGDLGGQEKHENDDECTGHFPAHGVAS